MHPDHKHRPARTLEPDLLLAGYAAGYFPMAESRHGEIQWYSPNPRAVIPLDGLVISRSLAQTVRKRVFDIRIDTAFESVMRACAGREETWISDDIIASYAELHRLGHAHSIECWQQGNLVGGLYGVSLGAAFFGESMFSGVRDASKVALVFLVEHLNKRAFRLLDTQFLTPHLARLGAVEIPRGEYLKQLRLAIPEECQF